MTDVLERDDTVTIKLGLTAEELRQRIRFVGGSDANILMAGDEGAIYDLWQQKLGLVPGPDLSEVLPVQIGIWTEELNARWYYRTSGRAVTSRNKLARHTGIDFMAANLDGLTATTAGHPAVLECKHVNAFSNIEEVEQRYMPQLHHNMLCAGMDWAVLSVFLGTQKYEIAEVALDQFYAAQLVQRERDFWSCVVNKEPPRRMASIAGPVAPEKFRTVDFEALRHNEWAAHAGVWLQNRASAKNFETAAKGLKALIEPDVGTAVGYGISARRSKAGAITIKGD